MKKKKQIAVIDDDVLFLEVFEELTRDGDYNYEFYSNGVQFLEACKHIQYDLIITDVDIPEMPADLIISRLNKEDILASTPVLLCSGTIDDKRVLEIIEKGKSALAIDYIEKPFNIKMLLNKAKILLRLRDLQIGC